MLDSETDFNDHERYTRAEQPSATPLLAKGLLDIPTRGVRRTRRRDLTRALIQYSKLCQNSTELDKTELP